MATHTLNMRLIRLLTLALPALAALGCSNPPVEAKAEVKPPSHSTEASEAEKFLRWSMNRYAALKSYEADASWSLTTSGGTDKLSETRTIAIANPNRFKIFTVAPDGTKMTTVSDGKAMVEYVQGRVSNAKPGEAPATISADQSEFMQDPRVSGSLLYQFFGGSDNFDGLVDVSKSSVVFGKDVTADGEASKTVLFYGTRGAGHVEAVIGMKTGFVHSLDCDEDGFRQQAMAENPSQAIPHVKLHEAFIHVSTDENLPSSAFDTKLPAGVTIQAPQAKGDSPVPIGSPAPDGELAGLDGKKVKLSSLKGSVVLIDFWATWCGPCRISLPNTNEAFQRYHSKGLKVLAVDSDDGDASSVAPFLQQNKYSFPAFLDQGGKLARAYHVEGIPCVAIIDAKGNLSSYSIGVEQKQQLFDDLKKAGLKE